MSTTKKYTHFLSNLTAWDLRTNNPIYNWKIEGDHPYDEKLLEMYQKDNPYQSVLKSTLHKVHIHIDTLTDFTIKDLDSCNSIMITDTVNCTFEHCTKVKDIIDLRSKRKSKPILFKKCYLQSSDISFDNAVFIDCEIANTGFTGDVKAFKNCSLSYVNVRGNIGKISDCDMFLCDLSDKDLKKARESGNNINVADVVYFNEYRIVVFGEGYFKITNSNRNTGGIFEISELDDKTRHKIGEYCFKFVNDNIALLKSLDKEVQCSSILH